MSCDLESQFCFQRMKLLQIITTLAVESFNNSHHRREFSEHCREVAVMGSFSCQRMCE